MVRKKSLKARPSKMPTPPRRRVDSSAAAARTVANAARVEAEWAGLCWPRESIHWPHCHEEPNGMAKSFGANGISL